MAHAFIADDFPEIHTWMLEQIQVAVKQAWLIDA